MSELVGLRAAFFVLGELLPDNNHILTELFAASDVKSCIFAAHFKSKPYVCPVRVSQGKLCPFRYPPLCVENRNMFA